MFALTKIVGQDVFEDVVKGILKHNLTTTELNYLIRLYVKRFIKTHRYDFVKLLMVNLIKKEKIYRKLLFDLIEFIIKYSNFREIIFEDFFKEKVIEVLSTIYLIKLIPTIRSSKNYSKFYERFLKIFQLPYITLLTDYLYIDHRSITIKNKPNEEFELIFRKLNNLSCKYILNENELIDFIIIIIDNLVYQSQYLILSLLKDKICPIKILKQLLINNIDYVLIQSFIMKYFEIEQKDDKSFLKHKDKTILTAELLSLSEDPIFHKNLHEYVNKYKLDSKNMLILMNNYITSNECWSGNDEVMWRYLISTNPTLDDFKLLNPFMHIVALKVWEIPKENLLYYIGLKSLKSLSLGFLYYIFYNLPKDIVNYFVIFLGDLIDIQTLLFSMYFNTFRF